jgi:flagellar basal body-associated protein FliL
MTEENKDSTPPKLRLSRRPKDDEAQAQPDQAAESKPDLKLQRPSENSPPAESRDTGAKPAAPEIETPEEAEKPPVEPSGERPFDPENPFAGIEVKKPKTENPDRPPPELPSKPAPPSKDGSGRKVEEAIDRIGDEKKSHSVLTSLIVIIILIAILGGAGYGLYYIFSSNTGTAETEGVAEQQAAAKEKEESGGLLSGPIAKAKETIAKIPDSAGWEKEEKEATAAAEKTVTEDVSENEAEPVVEAATDTEKPPSTIDPSQTDSISEFLQNAHVGGVRTGDRPKLILNGKSYNKGDLIDPNNGLRFIGIRDEKLAFQDTQGIVYIKSF